ncbi:MAG: ATP-binding cassette domain-containing protein [Roseburia sp.]|nr:ATP-binding cassette domain-containing protein [Roseburia sp.]
MESSAAIRVENAVKVYGNQTVLDHVSLEIRSGEICGIVGRNGSGKTVLFKSICGFTPLTEGRITVGDKVIGKDVDMPDRVGAIIENPGFLNNYSGYKNLKFLAMIRKRIGKEEIHRAIKKVGLDPDSKKWVGKYSLGMRQRLGLAQAIMENPDILILDEPMNGLDNQGVEDMRKMLLEQRDQGKTILMASHNPADIDILCDVVYEMDQGVLRERK